MSIVQSRQVIFVRASLSVLLALAALPTPSTADDHAPRGSIVTDQNSGDDTENCVEVEIGGSKALDCINRRLKRETDRIHPVPNIPPNDARSQDPHLGIVNTPALQQQYGPNFGHSVTPYRPPAPVFTPPLGGH